VHLTIEGTKMHKKMCMKNFRYHIFFCRIVKACSLGLSTTSQQYFSLRTNQPPATSRNQPAVLFSQNKPAPAISHQPTEQAVNLTPAFCDGVWGLEKISVDLTIKI
jgi:hypothetical protein